MKSISNIHTLEKKLTSHPEFNGNSKNFPPANPSFFFKAVSYMVIVGAVTPGISLFMKLFNRTRILGKENIAGLKPPWIMASNHLTLLDDLFLEPLIIFPNVIKGYKYFPFHVPEETNFYKVKLISWFMRQCKAIPLIRGNGILQDGMNKIIEAVKDNGILHIYPEGTRSRTGQIGSAKAGIGRIVCETNAPVVPIYHQGLEKVLPIGKGFPRIGKEIRVSIGKPIYFDNKIESGNEIACWKDISARIIEAIKEQKAVMDDKWGVKPIVMGKPHK